jgi:RHS repeat-associated protein
VDQLSGSRSNRLTQAGTTTYTYDANGNLTAISTGRTFAWDVFNRLTSTTASGSTVTYTYNGDGLKVRRVGPTGTTNYYHDGSRPIWETNGAGAMTAQYDRDTFGNLLSRRDSANVRHYFHFDALGSTTALTNASGTVSATMLYDAWGNQRAITGSGHGNYRFTGSERDATTGLYHMGARFYDPAIGRWLSEDPVQDTHFEPATLNFYAYALNNPVLHTDPDGKAVWFLPVVLFLGRAAYTAWNLYTIAAVLTSDATLSAKVIQLILAGIGVKWPAGKFWAALRLVGRMGPYSELSKLTAGFRGLIEAHHLIPRQIAHFFSLNADEVTSVIMWGPDHRSFTNALTEVLKGVTSKEEAWAELLKFYAKNRPDLLQRLLQWYPKMP